MAKVSTSSLSSLRKPRFLSQCSEYLIFPDPRDRPGLLADFRRQNRMAYGGSAGAAGPTGRNHVKKRPNQQKIFALIRIHSRCMASVNAFPFIFSSEDHSGFFAGSLSSMVREATPHFSPLVSSQAFSGSLDSPCLP